MKRHGGRTDKENDPWCLENTLMAVHVVTKAFKFFRTTAVANEEAPEALVDISKRLVAPAHRLVFGPMAEALSRQGGKEDENGDAEQAVVNVKLMVR